ncbi:hypothetical protein [Bacteroides graminisolvens]|nr:hypothetical protein [Bacteroides graminisolvens]
MSMSELIVKPGSWNSFNSSETEAFLAAVSRVIGFTSEQQAFLKRVHDDIHRGYTPDQYYQQNLSILINWMPPMLLAEIKKDCDADHKKQVKIWYHELIDMADKSGPFYQMLIPQMTQMVDEL